VSGGWTTSPAQFVVDWNYQALQVTTAGVPPPTLSMVDNGGTITVYGSGAAPGAAKKSKKKGAKAVPANHLLGVSVTGQLLNRGGIEKPV
jgi:hypothetical protein